MKVTNNTPDPLIAFGIATKYGYGDDVLIKPGETQEVSGPALGEMGGSSCHVHLEGEIMCHTASDTGNAYQVTPGGPLSLQSGGHGITVRHHLDPVEAHVQEWRDHLR